MYGYEMNLIGSHIDDSQVEAIVEKNLNTRGLMVRDCEQVSARGLQPIAQLTNLRELVLEHGSVTDEFVPFLPKAKSLSSASFHGCSMTDIGLNAVLEMYPDLYRLNFSGNRVTGAGLSAGESLRMLWIWETSLEAEYVARIPETCPHLRELTIDGLREDQVLSLCGCQKLESLKLWSGDVSEELVLELATRLPQLQTVSVPTQFEDEAKFYARLRKINRRVGTYRRVAYE